MMPAASVVVSGAAGLEPPLGALEEEDEDEEPFAAPAAAEALAFSAPIEGAGAFRALEGCSTLDFLALRVREGGGGGVSKWKQGRRGVWGVIAYARLHECVPLRGTERLHTLACVFGPTPLTLTGWQLEVL